MSIPVPVEDLARHVRDYPPGAYVLVGAASGPPRVTHSAVRVEEGEIVASVGRRSAAALAANPTLCVLWPATDEQSMSLIVDGEVIGTVDADGGEVRIRPTGAVHHRPPGA